MKKITLLLSSIILAAAFCLAGCSTDAAGSSEGSGKDVSDNVSVPSYTVVFHANGGYGTMSKMVCEVGKSYAVPECKFYRNGYIFYGWDGLKFKPHPDEDYYEIRNKIYNLSETDGDIIILSAQWMKQWTLDESGDFVTGDGKTISKTGIVQVLPKTTAFLCAQEEGAFTIERNRIVLSKYAIGKYEVTNELYYTVMGKDIPEEWEMDSDYLFYPVENVNWYSAIIFCNRLTLLMGKTPCYSVEGVTEWGRVQLPSEYDYGNNSFEYYSGRPKYPEKYEAYAKDWEIWYSVKCDWTANGYRLPTECEWECAARGGVYSDNTSDPWNYRYSGSNSFDEVGNRYRWNPVGLNNPNTLGLYDMTGNVEEMCWDLWGKIDENTPVTGTASYNSDQNSEYCNLYENDYTKMIYHVVRNGGYHSEDSSISQRMGGGGVVGFRLACIGE